MRKLTLIFSFFLVALLVVPWSQASAQVPLEIIHKRDIKFGEYASDVDVAGTVVLSPDSDTTFTTGGAVSFGGTIRRGRFQLVGEPRAFVNVTLPTSITIRRGTSAHSMVVDSFTIDRPNPIRLSNQGKRTINIGATLRIGVNQRKGNYNDDNAFTIDGFYE